MNPNDYIKNPQKFHETYSKEEMLEYAKEKEKQAKKRRTTFTVEEVRGVCPLYKEGDVACVIETGIYESLDCSAVCGGKLCLGLLDNTHFRTSWANLERPYFDHLEVYTGECRTCCTHPGPPYTPCGGVIFRITRDDEAEDPVLPDNFPIPR